MLTDDTAIQAAICSIFRQASLQQMRQFSACPSLELVELDEAYALGQVVSRQMVLIVISADELLVTFKLLFNATEADRLRQLKFPHPEAEEDAKNALTLDYVKELVNQICGRICRVFQVNGLSLGMSIPLSMHGFYEIYTDYTAGGALHKFSHAWRINGEFGSMICTAQVEITQPHAVDNLQILDEPTPNDDDELEFL